MLCCCSLTVHPRACGEHLVLPMFRLPITVHPRACGEHCPTGRWTVASGSSPRVRGTCQFLIPLCHFLTVHPRACGEHSPWRTQPCRSGSSPRVRGTSYRCICTNCLRRFIPARAGNIARLSAQLLSTFGSSPRVRGTLASGRSLNRRSRFIPARAGNTSASACRLKDRAVHPRACGEHMVKAMPACMRSIRFIPARAGNISNGIEADIGIGSSPRVRGTSMHIDVAGALTVHPRACGEHSDTTGSRLHGSSPRVRGTSNRAAYWPTIGSSPRVRGTSIRNVIRLHDADGSSPRVRGTYRQST